MDGRQVGCEIVLYLHAPGLELVFEQRKRIDDDLIDVDLRKFGAAGPGEVQQIVDDLGRAESLARDLLEQRRFFLVTRNLLGKHLRVGGDYGERRIDLVCDAGGEQADGRHFLRLRELRFEADAFGDVVDDDDAPDDVEPLGDERRDSDVGDAGVACVRAQAELVQVVDAGILAHAIELFHEAVGENFADGLADSFRARKRVHHFHLRVPRLDAVGEVDCQHADADGFDDVLVEVFQPFVLTDFLFERRVEARVLNSDAEIPGQGLKQLHVFAGEEVAFHRLTQPEHRDHALLHGAGNVVVQIKTADGFLCASVLAEGLVCVVEEQVAFSDLRPFGGEEAEIELVGPGDAIRLCKMEAARVVGSGGEDREARDEESLRKTLDDEVEHLIQIGLGVQVSTECDQGAAIVVALAIEELVEMLLDPILYRIEEQRSDGDGNDQAGRPGVGNRLLYRGADQGDGPEVHADDGRGRNGVRHAALEDQIDVHQAVTHDGIAEGQRQEDQREHRDLHAGSGRGAMQIRDDVEERERRDRHDGA